MKKAGRVILITAAVLLLIGLLLLIAALASNHWDFSAVVGGEYRSRTVRLEEAIRDISIRCGTEDVRFVQSEDGVCSVEFYERENEPHSAAVLDGTLTVTVEDQREWYQRITLLSFERPSITVHLPRSKYAALHIENSTGAVEIPGEFRFDSIELSTDTGSLRCGASALEQIRISKEVLHSRRYNPEIFELVKGLMIESYIVPGAQKVGCEPHVYGQSITDPCLGWEDSEKLIYDIYRECMTV